MSSRPTRLPRRGRPALRRTVQTQERTHMTQTRNHYEARWTEIGNRYQIIDQPWISQDGIEWIDAHTSEPVDTEEFHNASITMVGGPFNGEVIG